MAEPIPFNSALDPMARIEAVDGGHLVRFHDCPKLAAQNRLFEEVWPAWEHAMRIFAVPACAQTESSETIPIFRARQVRSDLRTLAGR